MNCKRGVSTPEVEKNRRVEKVDVVGDELTLEEKGVKH